MDAELPIEWPEQKNPPKRPKLSDDIVVQRAAKECRDNLKHQWEAWENFADCDNIIVELADMFKKVLMQDGYDMAHWLEKNAGWSPDAALVEILDAGWLYDARSACVKDWVRINNPRPKFKVGEDVLTPKGIGMVIEVIEVSAEYTVMIQGRRQLFAYEVVSAA